MSLASRNGIGRILSSNLPGSDSMIMRTSYHSLESLEKIWADGQEWQREIKWRYHPLDSFASEVSVPQPIH